MRTTVELLSDLDRLGVELWLEGDRIRYKAPGGVLTAASLDELREHKSEIRELLRRSCLSLPPIPRIPRDGALPLAVAQEGFWSLEQLVPGNSLSTVFSAFRISGPLDAGRLSGAFDEIVCRHEALRTTFNVCDAQPVQVISSAGIARLVLEDLKRLPEAERESACLRRIIEQAQGAFDLVRGPLLRITLLAIADCEHLLLLALHHIIGDAWSVQVLISELLTLYEASVAGHSSPLPALSAQYIDFAAWQRQLLREGALDAQLSYWKQKLSDGNLPDLSLPVDFPRSKAHSFQSSGEKLALPPSLSAALKHVSHEAGCTLFMTLLAILKIALHAFTGQKDIRVGTLVASRNHEQLDRMIGLFTNTLVLRTQLDGDPSIRDVLGRVRETVLEAYECQDLPFGCLVQALEREHNIERAALFRVLFLFNNQSPQILRMGDLTVQLVDLGTGLLEANTDFSAATTFDLILTLAERPEGISGSLVFKKALFSSATISRMSAHFLQVAEWVASRSDERLSAMPAFARS